MANSSDGAGECQLLSGFCVAITGYDQSFSLNYVSKSTSSDRDKRSFNHHVGGDRIIAALQKIEQNSNQNLWNDERST